MKNLSIQLFLSLLCISAYSQTKSVLFIGNSYTGVNNLPVMTKDLALSLQDTLIIDSNTPGGTTFNSHTSNSTSLAKIAQGNWDYVILQAQSQEPSFPPSQVASQTYPYAAILVDSILSANECTIPLFYMTWGRQNGDANNCASYPVICTYDGMQSRLRESYLEMAIDNDAEVSPVGAAWKYVRDNHPAINLYSADESHPSVAGSYLAACVHYASIYKKSPVGATYISSLTSGDAANLQNAAKLIVLDSLENWNFGIRNVQSEFNYSPSTGAEIDFMNTSSNSTDYLWDFGDGSNSIFEHPTHDYIIPGTYDVTLIATSACNSDTVTQSIVVSIDGIQTSETIEYIIRINPQTISITSTKFNENNVQLVSMEGKMIYQNNLFGTNLTIPKPKDSGIYLIKISNKLSSSYSKKLFIH